MAPTRTAHTRAPLGDLLDRLSDEPSIDAALGRREPVIAIGDAGRALVLAGLVAASDRRPVLVGTPTQAEAERLATDAAAVLGADRVFHFPAWETLPFERVSPGVETMGQRLRVLHRLGTDRPPALIVASARALVQRIDPEAAIEPIVIEPGAQLDPVELVERLVMLGYRREGQVEHRGEVAVRGSIVDVYPSTADAPVRVDLWGDEVDRLTEFAVADQRSTVSVDRAVIYPCREFRPTDARRERAAALVGEEPWGREQWDRFADGVLFDGMESWLPWLVEGDHLLTDLIGADGLVAFVEPRRVRDRAAEIIAEEADLASSLARTWDVAADDVHRLHLPFDRLLARTDAAAWSILATPDQPSTPVVAASGWEPVVGDLTPTANQIRSLLDDDYTVVVAADGEASAQRLAALLTDHGVSFAATDSARRPPGTSGHRQVADDHEPDRAPARARPAGAVRVREDGGARRGAAAPRTGRPGTVRPRPPLPPRSQDGGARADAPRARVGAGARAGRVATSISARPASTGSDS